MLVRNNVLSFRSHTARFGNSDCDYTTIYTYILFMRAVAVIHNTYIYIYDGVNIEHIQNRHDNVLVTYNIASHSIQLPAPMVRLYHTMYAVVNLFY